jgi:hypothetical protein
MTTTPILEVTDTQPVHPDPAGLTPETVPVDHYFSPADLACMSVETLDELFMAIPERPFYDKALEQCIFSTHGIAGVADHERSQVIDECLLIHDGLHAGVQGISIPLETDAAGEVKWVTVSDAIIDQVRDGKVATASFAAPEKKKTNPMLFAGVGAGALGLICVMTVLFSALLGGGEEKITEVDMTATALAEAEPAMTPTLTPVALANIDRSIKGGDDLKSYYPTMLEIQPANVPSRIFPVQQRQVEVADWHFEQNPDVATSILGLVVQPVIGIPYSDSNKQFLEKLEPGDVIRLQMNTGHTNIFSVSDTRRVDRQDAGVFSQSRPGIKLVLIAGPETDRLVVDGAYLPEQEVEAQNTLGVRQAQAIQPGQPAGITQGVTAAVEDAYVSQGPSGEQLAPEWQYLLVDLSITTAEQVEFSTGKLAISAVGPAGQRYTPIHVDQAITRAFPYTSMAISQGTTALMTVGFLVPANLSSATLSIQAEAADNISFALPYAPTAGLAASSLDVLLLDVLVEGDQQGDLLVTVRFFNAHTEQITVRPSDILAVFSPVLVEDRFPIGPAVQPEADLPMVIRPGEARDVCLTFPWAGDPYVGVTIAGYQYTITIR